MMARIRSIVVCLGALVLATPARADTAHPMPFQAFPTDFEQVPVPTVDPYSYAWSDPRMLSVIGISAMIGGGVTGFTDGAVRDTISNPVAFAWNVRLTFGTRIPLCIEANYFGNAAQVVTLSGADNGFLIGTAVEGALRWNVLPHADGTPYLFAGAGWQNYFVENPQFPLADSGMRSSDNVAQFPLGAGMAYRDPTGWIGDVRATFRFTTEADLVTLANDDHPTLDSWEASAAIGYEF